MKDNKIHLKRVLISQSNKTGLVAFTKSFQKNNVKIISTGETADFLKK